MPRLRTTDALAAPIPVPPYAEQRRIVRRAESLMSLCDRLESALRQRGKVCDEMTAAVYGQRDARLVKSHTAWLTADSYQVQLLREGLLNLAVLGGFTAVRCGSSGGEGEPLDGPVHLPSSWRWVSMADLYSNRGQHTPSRPITYIDVSSIDNKRGEVAEPTVLSAQDAPTRARKVVDIGDVIYSCVRPYLSNVAIIDRHFDPPPIASTAFAVLNGRGSCLSRYLWMILRSPFMRESVRARMRGQSYPAIKDADFKAIQIPLPPIDEQRRIVERIGHLSTLSEDLEAAIAERDGIANALVEAMMPR